MFVTCPKCFSKYQIPAEIYLPTGKQVKCSHCQHIFALANENVEQSTVPVETVQVVEPVMPEPSNNFEEQRVVNIDPEPVVFADEQPTFQQEESSGVPEAFAPPEESAVLPEPEQRRGFRIHNLIIAILILMAAAAFVFIGWSHPEFLSMDWLRDSQQEAVEPVGQVVDQNTSVDSFKPQQTNEEQRQVIPAVEQNIDSSAPQVLPEIHSVRFELRSGVEATVRIEGVLKNSTAKDILLPKTVHAVAYNTDGKVLFEKDIYLSDKVLPAGEERNFFGSYSPVQGSIQWVEVTF